jgi:hypothetical protein
MAITLHTDVTDLPEQTELAAGRERDEFQQKVDSDVAALKTKTATAGWPAPDPKRHFQRYVVGKDDRAALKSVIRRAGTLHKVEAQFYKDAVTEAGHAVVKFHLARKTDKDGKPVADDTLNADGTPKPTPKA